MRFFFSLLLSSCFLFAAESTTSEKIDQKSKSLKNTFQEEQKLSKKLEDIASGIFSEEKALQLISQNIQTLEGQINDLQANSQEASAELENLTRQNMNLVRTKKELEQKIIRIIAEEFSFYLVTDRGYQDSLESILADEILEQMDAIIKKDFIKLTQTYSETNSQIDKHNQAIMGIKHSLKSLKQKQASLLKLKSEQQQSIVKLEQEKVRYKKRLSDIQEQKDELKKTLEQLKIIKKEEDAAELAAREKRQISTEKLSVRQLGSSYQKSQVKRYRGAKTIAPLDDFTVKQQFGNYVDPVYKIKIFNEAIVLQAKSPDAKVKNVLSGKVIFAKETGMLDKVVIVENSNGIHTIYAHLTKIAPTIEVGKKIKQGYVIGRIDDDLTFEVTQQNYHIDPLELIQTK